MSCTPHRVSPLLSKRRRDPHAFSPCGPHVGCYEFQKELAHKTRPYRWLGYLTPPQRHLSQRGRYTFHSRSLIRALLAPFEKVLSVRLFLLGRQTSLPLRHALCSGYSLRFRRCLCTVSYTHLRAHETDS